MSEVDSPPPADLTAPLLAQRWETYTGLDHTVWRRLYARRMTTLASTGSAAVLEGMERIGLAPDRIPDLADVNRRLAPLTGWQAVPVAGFVPAADFFDSLARRRFPTTITIRPPERLDYLPEPDIFHDVFGHVPLHSDPVFAGLLQRFGRLGARARHPAAVTALARLFWFTVEFGLVREAGEVRIYGSGLVSSISDAANALGPGCDRRPFDLDDVIAHPFAIDRLQEVLFVAESLEQVADGLTRAESLLDLG
jgi:phenylalanine-4-hydroxylase